MYMYIYICVCVPIETIEGTSKSFGAFCCQEYPAMAHPEEYPESPVDLRNEVQHPMALTPHMGP